MLSKSLGECTGWDPSGLKPQSTLRPRVRKLALYPDERNRLNFQTFALNLFTLNSLLGTVTKMFDIQKQLAMLGYFNIMSFLVLHKLILFMFLILAVNVCRCFSVSFLLSRIYSPKHKFPKWHLCSQSRKLWIVYYFEILEELKTAKSVATTHLIYAVHNIEN